VEDFPGFKFIKRREKANFECEDIVKKEYLITWTGTQYVVAESFVIAESEAEALMKAESGKDLDFKELEILDVRWRIEAVDEIVTTKKISACPHCGNEEIYELADEIPVWKHGGEDIEPIYMETNRCNLWICAECNQTFKLEAGNE
jgi:hypothetical protein